MRFCPRHSRTRDAYQRRDSVLCCALAVVLPLIGACAKKDFKSELDRAQSWTATTYLAADRRAAGATNDAVTVQLRDAATKASAKARMQLPQLAHSDSERAAARSALDSLEQGIRHLRQVVP